MNKQEIQKALIYARCYDPISCRWFIDTYLHGTSIYGENTGVLDTPEKLGIFIGQLSVESAGLTRLEENTNYSPSRILAVFGKYVKTMSHAEALSKDPKALFDLVYHRKGLGNGPTDGYRFRGRGYLQLTGRANYEAYTRDMKLDIVESPELLATYGGSFYPGLWYFCTRKYKGSPLLELAQLKDHNSITRAINGGTRHLNQRIKRSQAAILALQGGESEFEFSAVSSTSPRFRLKQLQCYLKALDRYSYGIDGRWGKGTSAGVDGYFGGKVTVITPVMFEDLEREAIDQMVESYA